MIIVSVDFCYYTPLQEVLESISAHKGRILSFITQGPGGGNPELTLGFDTEEQAMDFLRDHSPEDDAFNRTLLRKEEL